MVIYSYDRVTNEYINSSTADQDPKIAGNYLLPAFSTPIPPPPEISGYARCFLNGKWMQIPDYRGQTVYNTTTAQPLVISELGEIPDDYVATQPPLSSGVYIWKENAWTEDFLQQKERLIKTIQEIMDAKANKYSFDTILSAVSYSNSTIEQFKIQGQAFLKWRDDVWVYCYSILDGYEHGTGDTTTEEKFLANLPAFPLDSK